MTHRFDDALGWRLVEKMFAPIISVFLAYVVFRVQYEHRMTAVEIKAESLDKRLENIEHKIDRILERVK